MTYGTIIPGLVLHGRPAPYPVVNERAIRATAGIMFAIGLSTFWYVFLTGDRAPTGFVVAAFWLDFFLKAVFGPQLSIFGFFGRWLVRGQQPEFVGAIQKRFAWSLGLGMASLMVALLLFGVRGPATFAVCGTCLAFMWLESACGICVGCRIYSFLLAKKILPEPAIRPACPGGACEIGAHKK